MKKKLTVKKKGEKKVITEQTVLDNVIFTVGNNPTASIELPGKRIAPEQFVVINEKNQSILMNRANGTRINGKDIGLGGQMPLKIGDKIEIDQYTLIFQNDEPNGGEKKENINLKRDQTIISKSGQKKEETKEEKLQNEKTKFNPKLKQEKDFSDVLDNLEKEESFYFQIIKAGKIIEKVNFDVEEIWIGIKSDELAIIENKVDLNEAYAQVKKDWSGAVIYPTGTGEISLNNKILIEPARLKNEDKITPIKPSKKGLTKLIITFNEPRALLELNSILPKELPVPISIDEKKLFKNPGDDLKDDPINESGNRETDISTVHAFEDQPKYFGYFTAIEILIMATGTLVTAVIIFFLLELI